MVNRAALPPELYSRYGIKPRNNVLLALVAGLGALLAIFVFASICTKVEATTEVRLITWQVQNETSVKIEFSVYQADDKSLVCVVRAQDSDRFDVGYGIGAISHPALRPTINVTLKTREPAFAVPTPVCDVANAASLVGSHFRPGLLPPAQSDGLFAPWQHMVGSLD